MALFVHTTGILAKLFSEAVEAIDPRPVEAIRTTGASRLQQVIFGVIPQVLPLWISFSLYRLESNIRSATVLGLIGAGGIGQVMFETIRGFYYSQAAAVLVIVVITVSLMTFCPSSCANSSCNIPYPSLKSRPCPLKTIFTTCTLVLPEESSPQPSGAERADCRDRQLFLDPAASILGAMF